MALGILGPLEVRLEDGEPAALGGHRQRALLAILILHANEVVSTDRLIDQLWGEHPPATAVHTVRVFVSRLRRALGPAGARLVTRPPGYVIEVGVDEVDADRSERLFASARAALADGEPREAEALLRDAERLWRGPPLADFTYEPFAQATIARLEEVRIGCREHLIEAELALGRHADVVGELEALVREHPFRERPRGQLMLALYRSGRQADALDAFQQARHTLVEELAVEPSEALRDLEQAILRQDPSLAAPSQPVQEPAANAGSSQDRAAEPARATTDGAAAAAFASTVRKTATVLVVRLAAAGATDPERARSLIAAARGDVERVVAQHGGMFVSGLAGEVVGIFGVPVTKEDDALRAVRAAHELRAAVATIESGELTVRIGLDTGEVVADAPNDVFGEPLGEAVAFALVAANGDVLLSDATRRLAAEAIRIEPALDGAAWRLVDLIDEAPGIRRSATPMVSREQELSAAQATFALAVASGEPRVLTVVGDAGIGKSRLAAELVHKLGDQATVLSGHCLSYGEGAAFWPIREALAEAARGDTRDAVRGLLDDSDDAELVADVVSAVLGLAPGETGGEQVPWAFRRLLEQLARQRPVVLVIEDSHWAEEPLLDLVDYLIDWLTAPVLILCLGRPELLELRPAWGGGRVRVSSLVLAPLDDEASSLLLAHQLGERSLSIAERARILQAAEGNPLFVEQLLAMAAENPWWDHERDIPATVQSLLAARLDRLGPGERAFIERAAVIGREFWPGAVLELLPEAARPSAAQHLRTLVRRGLIQPDRSSLAGEDQLRFHHILIRDVAYRSTPKALRSELHEQFAGWVSQRGEGFDEFLGFHLEQAVQYRRELGRPDDDTRPLASRAGEHLAIAGRRALSRGDPNAGARLLTRSADQFGFSGERRPDVLLELGSALSESGDFRGAEGVLQTSLQQARAAGAESTSARVLIELSYQRALVDPSAGVDGMLDVAERAIEVFERERDDGGLARAWMHVAEVHWTRSRCAEMEQVLERALTHAERAGERRQRSRILGDLARATVIGPRSVGDGIDRCNRILERADDDVPLRAVAETMLAVLEAMSGRFDDARERWQSSMGRLEAVGLSVTVAILQMYRVFVELLAGTPGRATQSVTEAYAVLERTGERRRLATTAALLGRLLYAQGSFEESDRYSRIAEEGASRDDVVTQVLWRGTRGKLLARGGEPSAGDELVSSAVTMAAETDFLMLHGDVLCDRAEVLAAAGAPVPAAADLERAIALYERKGNAVSADAAGRSLATVTAAATRG
jgi:DNA-binding SARP family transcriptional activator/ATP/maltotriose-dependent transcriptional regulator MalT